jgi:hypothetical protein
VVTEKDPTRCPNCGAARAADAAECSGCGVIFAKLAAVKARAMKEVESLPAPEPPAEDAEKAHAARLWKIRAVAAGIVAAWIVGFGLYYRAALAAARLRASRADIRTRPAAFVRTPGTGEIAPVGVHVAPTRAAPAPPPPTPAEETDEFEKE